MDDPSSVAINKDDITPQQTYVPQILCKECLTPISFVETVGFCRGCGGPLCPKDMSNTLTFKDNQTIISPSLIFGGDLQAEVIVCHSCYDRYHKNSSLAVKKSILAGLTLSFVLIVATALVGVPILDPAPTIIFLVFGAFLAFIVYLFLVTANDKEFMPSCPACGTNVMPLLFYAMRHSENSNQENTNYIHCYCGYYGPRMPIDGLWKFVDKKGSQSFENTFLEQHARYSSWVRHNPKNFV